MSKFSRKQTSNTKESSRILSDKRNIMVALNGNVKVKLANKFKGMSEDLEWFEPVIIPGYINIG